MFDFSESVYGKELTIEFISYLRPERKFSAIDELISQIHRDADQAKTLLTSGRG
ncbi:riboflavin kinase [Paenibacillus sp. TAB 01]|uniref:riboflavin kinase n=1 Tax=Paenibacillus sp. TAB 01 TaxID=3368988 RepID=UPI00375111A3